jgi:hypothetical protein
MSKVAIAVVKFGKYLAEPALDHRLPTAGGALSPVIFLLMKLTVTSLQRVCNATRL